LSGKSPHRALQRLSIGLIEMVDYLKGQSLNPFWYYYDIALMVEGRLPVEDG
jgi:ethanolamine utilization protein EutQ (cupin superfamily)